jgi:DNA (cytosine-5)-methyltransferase 1
MSTYYSENDPKAAAWLRELIKDGLISDGEVDTRSISDVRGQDFAGFERCHFFAGIGGWDYALQIAGWRGPVWTGSCPCQPFSQAGKGKGESDKRHLWPDFRRLIEECRPAAVFGEQVASKAGRRWVNGVRNDLEALDYVVGIADLCSPSVGAPHIRQRLYWVAESTDANRRPGISGAQEGTGADEIGRRRLGGSGDVGRLGYSNDPRSQGRWIDAGEYAGECAAGEAGAVGGLADSEEHGRRQISTNRRGRHEGGITEGRSTGLGLRGPSRGFWDLFDIVHCTDEKARRIEPSPQQMVDGLHTGLVPCSGKGAPGLEAGHGGFPLVVGAEARMMRLRGYGNAIVPQVAAEFIKEYMSLRKI